VDAIEKVTGEGKYTVDIKLPRMLYGKILRSSYPHARIMSIDTSKAESLPGVRAVITSKDTPLIPVTCFPPPYSVEDEYIFAHEKVRYVGERVAAVAAESEKVADEAAKMIMVEYEELPPVFDAEEAMKEDAPRIHDEANRNISRRPIEYEVGDIEKAFGNADYIFEDRYKTQTVCHCSMEPHAVVASFGAEGKLTVWTSTQIPFGIRSLLAQALNMPISKVRVIKPTHVGGGFGSKCDLILEGVCALLSKKSGRPVSMACNRKDEFYGTRVRHPFVVDLKTGVSKNGNFLARQATVFVSSGAYTSHGLTVVGHAGALFGTSYRCPNTKFLGYLAYTNLPVGGAMRGYGNPQITFAVESQIDSIAEALKIDPVEFRLKNHCKRGDELASKWIITSCGLGECIEKGAEKIHWEKRDAIGEKSKGRKRRGIGMASGVHVNGACLGTDTSSAFVKFNEDGTVNLITGASDIGQGLNTVLAQIVGEELGMSPGNVSIMAADTDNTPMDYGSFACRGTFVAGNAAKVAAKDAKRQLLDHASEMLEAAVDDLEIRNGNISVKGVPEKKIAISHVVVTAQYLKKSEVPTILGRGSYDTVNTQAPDPDSWRGNVSCGYLFAAQFADVEVDIDSGEVRVLKIVSAHDLGQAVNPMAAEGQIEGGIHMGLGFALSEKLVYDGSGKPINNSFLDYKMHGAADMPKIECVLVETIDPYGPFGSKGLGEPPVVFIAPAIANAIYNAVGVRIKELPITAEKVFKALREKQK